MTPSANPSPGFARNPDKKITVKPHRGEIVVSHGDIEIARSENAKLLEEDGHPAVIYIPFDDINFAVLEKTSSRTHCPYKGDATYWQVQGGATSRQDVMWAYEAPFDEMVAIRDHGAFFPERVTIGKA